jgi:fucose permease
MYSILQAAHSGTRWLVLVGVALTLVYGLILWFSKKPLNSNGKKLALFTMIFSHLQLVMGLILYFISPKVQLGNMAATMKDATLRFYAVEHITIMILAIVAITVGYSWSKRLMNTLKGSRILAIFMLIGFILLMLGIPWPPEHGAGWH